MHINDSAHDEVVQSCLAQPVLIAVCSGASLQALIWDDQFTLQVSSTSQPCYGYTPALLAHRRQHVHAKI
eukprot:10837-Heterococcus_DN1.PRE.1